MKKDLTISELNDLYGALLTEHQRAVVSGYFDYDLSLAEIAEEKGVSRQAIRDTIVKASEQLKGFESKLNMLEKRNKLTEMTQNAIKQLNEGNIAEAQQVLSAISDDL